MEPNQETVMVSGQTFINQAEFDRYYIPKIKESVDKGKKFVMGGALGVDKMTQEYLISIKYDPAKVRVWDVRDEDHRLSKDFKLVNGYESYPKRDSAMSATAGELIAFLHQYGSGGSGTFANLFSFPSNNPCSLRSRNLLRRKYDDKTAKEITTLFRDNAMEYDLKCIQRV